MSGAKTNAMARVHVGDQVTTVFDGEVVGIDYEGGTVTLRGNTRGAQHQPWTIDVHWATEFYDPADVERDPNRVNARITVGLMKELDEVRAATRTATLYDVAELINHEDPSMAERLRALARSFEVPRLDFPHGPECRVDRSCAHPRFVLTDDEV